MSLYVVTRKSDGVEVYRYNADAPIEWVGMEFVSHNHTLVPPPEPPPEPEPAPVLITKFAFRSRFTGAEKISIELASLDVPDGTLEARSAAAQVRVWLGDIEAAQYIDLMMTATRNGVQALEDFGLLDAGRAAVILDTPPTADEVWHG